MVQLRVFLPLLIMYEPSDVVQRSERKRRVHLENPDVAVVQDSWPCTFGLHISIENFIRVWGELVAVVCHVATVCPVVPASELRGIEAAAVCDSLSELRGIETAAVCDSVSEL